MSGRIDRYVVRAIGFTLVALVLFYLTVVNVSVSTISPPRRRLKLAPPLKCAPPRPPERPWQEFEAAPPGNNASSSLPLSSPSAPAWEFVASRDANNYGLSREQCGAAFPKLFAEIDKSVAARKGKNISFEDVDSRQMGSGEVRAMVYDGQVHAPKDSSFYAQTLGRNRGIGQLLTRNPLELLRSFTCSSMKT